MEDVYLKYCSGKKDCLETGYTVNLLGPRLRFIEMFGGQWGHM
jgi:hypothetical protein